MNEITNNNDTEKTSVPNGSDVDTKSDTKDDHTTYNNWRRENRPVSINYSDD